MKKPRWLHALYPDSLAASEAGQARIRVFNVSPVCLYLILAWYFQWQRVPAAVALGAAVYIAYTVAWLILVLNDMLPTTLRRFAAAALDQALPALGMYLAGFLAGYVAWVPALGSIGSGLRFGTRYTLFSSLVGVVTLGLAFSLSADWRSIPTVSVGILLANVLVPLYAVMLVKRFKQENQLLQHRAASLEHATMHDSLTGLLNRKGFFAVLDERNAQTKRQADRSAVMVIDLDGFKAINDTFGHAAGDKVLQAVAISLRNAFRANDSVARLGGDEFGIVLGQIGSEADVEALSSKALSAVENVAAPGPEFRLSASIGTCMLPQPHLNTLNDMLAAADQMMYKAKAQGKNRMCMFA